MAITITTNNLCIEIETSREEFIKIISNVPEEDVLGFKKTDGGMAYFTTKWLKSNPFFLYEDSKNN